MGHVSMRMTPLINSEVPMVLIAYSLLSQNHCHLIAQNRTTMERNVSLYSKFNQWIVFSCLCLWMLSALSSFASF